MASWSDNTEAVARAVCAKMLAHDGISEEKLAADVDMWWHLVAAELESGSSTRAANTWAARSTGSARWPANATGCADTPRAARSGRPRGTERRYPATELCRGRAGPWRRTPVVAESSVAGVPTGTPVRSRRKGREGERVWRMGW